MMLVNVNNIFKDAVFNRSIDILEKVLSSSDSRIELIEEFAKKEDINLLLNCICDFKSKGLISDIEDHCISITHKLANSETSSESNSFVIKRVHYRNKEINKIKYLKEDTFLKTRLNSLGESLVS